MYIKLSSEILKIIIASKNWENMANLRRVILPFLIKFFFPDIIVNAYFYVLCPIYVLSTYWLFLLLFF